MGMQSVESRRSIRKFREDMISMELIDQVLVAGIRAPPSKSKQPWWSVVVGGETKEGMFGLLGAGLTREQNGQALLPKNRNVLPDAQNMLKVMKQALVIIIAPNEGSGSSSEAVNSKDRVTEIANAQLIGAAIENTILAMEELGLGTLWICNTFFVYTELRERLHTDRQLVAVIVLGYPDKVPPSRSRKKFRDAVACRLE